MKETHRGDLFNLTGTRWTLRREWASHCLLWKCFFLVSITISWAFYMGLRRNLKTCLSGKAVKISFLTDLFLEAKWNCSQNRWSSPPFYCPPRSWSISDGRGLLSCWSADRTSPVVFQMTGKQRYDTPQLLCHFQEGDDLVKSFRHVDGITVEF